MTTASRGLVRTLLAASLVTACDRPPVSWSADRSYPVTSGSATLGITAAGDSITDTTAALAARASFPAPLCSGSVRLARSGNRVAAAWWAPRADSTVVLLSAHSSDNALTWSAPSSVDTLDRERAGCRRAPPSIAVDSATGYVHLAYALVAPEGTGIFFAHSMDSGATFHSPVAILYGDHPGRTAIAASGDVVAVAFEDPNGRASRIGLALSVTMGHIFEERVLPVSDDNGAATQPVVAVGGRRIAVAWREASARGDSVLRIRAGTLR